MACNPVMSVRHDVPVFSGTSRFGLCSSVLVASRGVDRVGGPTGECISVIVLFYIHMIIIIIIIII